MRVAVSADHAAVLMRRKVIERKLTTREMAANLSEAELLEFLFLPGLSHATTVTVGWVRADASFTNGSAGPRDAGQTTPSNFVTAAADSVPALFKDGAFAARASTDGSPINGVMIPLKSGLIVQTANGGVMAFKIQ